MALKKYNPVTPSQRQLVNIDRSNLWKGKPYKSLTVGKKSSSGRNNQGNITIWNRGGGHKKLYRVIDFKRNKYDISAEVKRIEYDPNRSSFIALIRYEDGHYSYIVAPNKINVGDKVISSEKADIKFGNAMQLRNIPVGTTIHNIEIKIGKGGQIARSAGSYGQLVGRDGIYSVVKLSSGEVRLIRGECFATIGSVSNSDHKNRKYSKAGRSRWMGKRPNVRGVAMNPIDHPHGGGEGRTSGGRHPVTPWGKGTKGKKTRNNKRTTKWIIKSRKK